MRSAWLRSSVLSFLVLLAACGTPTTAAPHPTAADHQRLWLEYAACLRQHGATEPDPIFNVAGNPIWQINPKALPAAALQACAPILQSLGLTTSHSAGPEWIAQATRFSQCIRQHGIADFPDPDSSGNFPTQQDPTLEPGWTAAYDACKSLLPPGKP